MILATPTNTTPAVDPGRATGSATMTLESVNSQFGTLRQTPLIDPTAHNVTFAHDVPELLKLAVIVHNTVNKLPIKATAYLTRDSKNHRTLTIKDDFSLGPQKSLSYDLDVSSAEVLNHDHYVDELKLIINNLSNSAVVYYSTKGRYITSPTHAMLGGMAYLVNKIDLMTEHTKKSLVLKRLLGQLLTFGLKTLAEKIKFYVTS